MGHEMDVMNDILKIDGVKEATGTFGQFDIFVKVQAPTRSELDRIITKKNPHGTKCSFDYHFTSTSWQEQKINKNKFLA